MQPRTSTPAFELKGSMLTTMVLHIYTSEIALLSAQLQQHIAQAPSLFKQAPVILDFHAITQETHTLDILSLVETLRNYGMLPIGVRGGNPLLNSLSLGAGLHLLPSIKAERGGRDPVELLKEAEQPKPATIPAKIIEQPVRSGQQVVSKGDLIILSMVSPGAEVLAHRHIHVYGALRGRALAGVTGDTSARIFCQKLEAELVSVAGQYQINEELGKEVLGQSVQIYLKDDLLTIQTFTSINSKFVNK